MKAEVVDRFIGNKIKERRKSLRLSQTKLADLMGLSYQQIQKYEAGANKMTVNRLLQLSDILNVPVTFFYEGVKLFDADIGKAANDDMITKERVQPLSILLVDDSASDELLFREAVEASSEEVEVNSINDPDKLIDYMRNHLTKYGKRRPDIIFLDIHMPKTDGITLLQMIKKDQTINDIPVIILTNSISSKEMQDIYKKQAAGYILKSLDYDSFSENISKTIDYWSQVVVLPNM